MIHQLHPVNPHKQIKFSDLGAAGFYPFALSLDKFMDFISDVRVLDVSLFAAINNSFMQDLSAFSLLGAISIMDNFDAKDSESSFVGSSNRTIEPVGNMTSEGLEPLPSRLPNMLREYPVFRAGGAGGAVIIDFGKTLWGEGLFYPWVEVSFPNGMSSTAAGIPVGSVSFEDFGDIAIYAGDSLGGLSLGLATGSVKIKERFSDLVLDKVVVNKGDSITLSHKDKSINPKNLNRYIKAFSGSVICPVVATTKSLKITIPPNAKSGPLRIESESPQFDFFLTEDIKLLN